MSVVLWSADSFFSTLLFFFFFSFFFLFFFLPLLLLIFWFYYPCLIITHSCIQWYPLCSGPSPSSFSRIVYRLVWFFSLSIVFYILSDHCHCYCYCYYLVPYLGSGACIGARLFLDSGRRKKVVGWLVFVHRLTIYFILLYFFVSRLLDLQILCEIGSVLVVVLDVCICGR